ETSGECEQLAAERRRPCLAGVEALRGASPGISGSRERDQARVGSHAAVVDRRARDVQDAAASPRAQAVLPLLLVAAVLEGRVECAHALEGAAANRHVGAPGV